MSKKIRVTLNINCSDEFYEDHLKEMKDEILSGKFQRDIEEDGITKVTATFRIIDNE